MNVNLLSIFVASVVCMVIGFVWYGPIFGSSWMKLSGYTSKDMKKGMKGMQTKYAMMFVSTLVMSFVLSQFITFAGAFDALSGAMVGLWVAIGFIATTKFSDALFNKMPMELFYIDLGYRTVTLVLAGAILAMWH